MQKKEHSKNFNLFTEFEFQMHKLPRALVEKYYKLNDRCCNDTLLFELMFTSSEQQVTIPSTVKIKMFTHMKELQAKARKTRLAHNLKR